MQVTETLSEGLKRGFTVVIPQAEMGARRDKRFAELTKTMQLPGFRPGKVPLSLLRKRFGEAVDAEVLEASVNEATDAMMAERKLRPALSPKVELVENGAAGDVQFTVEMEILPDVAVPDLATLTLERPVCPVGDEDVAAELEKFAQSRSSTELVDEVRPVADGEILTVDFLGKRDGVPFDGGAGQDADIEMGGSGYIPGFAEQMLGMAPGEEKQITVTFPAEYQAAELAGQEATFDITAKALKRKVAAVLDDQFAETLGFETLDDLRGFFRTRLEQTRAGASRLKLKRALLDQLAEQASFAAPDSLVDAEFAEIWRQVEMERQAGRLDAEDAAKDEATLRAEYRAIADRRVRLGLLVAEIGRAHQIEVVEADLRRAMMAELQRFPGQEKMIMEFYQKNPRALDRLRGPIFEDKVVDHIIGKAQVSETTVSLDALMDEPEE